MNRAYISSSERETMTLAVKVWRWARSGGIRFFFLKGTLGSGKTAFVRGLARAAGVRRPVKSPSFVLTQEYPIRGGFFIHADLYRLERGSPMEDLALGDMDSSPGSVAAIEWAERLPASFRRRTDALTLFFFRGRGPDERRISIRWKGVVCP